MGLTDAMTKDGWVYLVAAEDMNAVKIGFTSSGVTKRVHNLQTGCPTHLHLVAYGPGSLAEEAAIFDRFKHLRLRGNGEWFKFQGELRDMIDRITWLEYDIYEERLEEEMDCATDAPPPDEGPINFASLCDLAERVGPIEMCRATFASYMLSNVTPDASRRVG